MLSEAWACAHPTHVVQRTLFEPQVIPGFTDSKKRILVYYFHGLLLDRDRIVTRRIWRFDLHNGSRFFHGFPIARRPVQIQIPSSENWTFDEP
jgi:hypothetical protein